MSSSNKILLLLLLLIMVVGSIASLFIPVQEVGHRQVLHTVNSGELTRNVLVGQTFTANEDNLSGVGVMFGTYSNRANTAPVEFHLRESLTASTDLRTAVVSPQQLSDNQVHRFEFEPIPDSGGKTYFFYVVSPTGTEGNAVAVDLNTQDPYHLGSAFIVRGEPGQLTEAAALQRSGKQTIDVVFSTYHTVSLQTATLNSAKRTVRWFIATWDEMQQSYKLWLQLAAPAVLLILLLVWLRGDGETERSVSGRVIQGVLGLLLIAAILFRLLYATSMPLTNDEGNYLYDAHALRMGVLAGGDGYVKAPIVIGWITLWQLLLGNTVLAGRMAMVVASSLMVIPLYHLGRMLWHQRAGIAVAAVWALLGSAAVSGVYIHTQAVALLLGVTGIAVLWWGLKREDPTLMPLFGAGMLLGLGVASRKSILALGLVPLLLILVESRSWSQRLQRLLVVGFGFLLVVAALLGWAYWLYGEIGIWEAIGLNSAEDGITAVDPAEADQVRAYSLRGMTPFFRESLPLFFMALLGWGVVLEVFVRRAIRRSLSQQPVRGAEFFLDHVLPKLGWLLPLAVGAWGWQFFFEYEGGIFVTIGGMPWLWYAGLILFVVTALWPRPQREQFEWGDEKPVVAASTQPVAAAPANVPQPRRYLNVVGALASVQEKREEVAAVLTAISLRGLLIAALLPAVWIGGLIFFYINWIKFHANYLMEFLPPLAVIGGVGAYLTWCRLRGRKSFEEHHPLGALIQRAVATLFLLVLFWGVYLTNYITYMYEHTGTFDLSAIEEAAAWARDNIPLEEPIFTGAAVVPYLSGHNVALHIAHPRWYAYEFTRKNTERLSTFLPPIEDMLTAYRSANWFMLESQTGFSFLMEYTEIEAGLERDWVLVHEVENLSNPLRFYRRK